jgi:hypothetical protein
MLYNAKVPFIKRYLMKGAVASFGWFYWRTIDKESLDYIEMIIDGHPERDYIKGTIKRRL